ncbi:PIN domain-containing protein [Actinoallomurus iriomotensis]|uniref:PIN domain-containing protein n=1 Tax=Actinoallomurus iriomotensis TaxID=478107 RepID=A0A9W6W5T3_9ACTN|nr:PIN domain-containing protein [Actinoallomurus iriomotensis]GLY92390.1 hypothetical protein Airi02_103180 [Actinoallomurus iriomotensis]
MIAGAVLDTSTIVAFGRGEPGAMLWVDQFDMKAQALLIPMTAMAEALTRLTRPAEAERALCLLEFGVAVDDGLDRENVRSVATAHLGAKIEITLGTAHAAHAARQRRWKVLTGDHALWTTAHPDVDAVPWAD